MMTPTAEAVVAELRRDSRSFSVGGRQFAVSEGVLRVVAGRQRAGAST